MRKIKNKIKLIFIIVIISFIFLSCQNGEDKKREFSSEIKKVEKIISLDPSSTEILVGLGLAEKIVAVDTYSKDVEGLKKDVLKIDAKSVDAEEVIKVNPDILIAPRNVSGRNFKIIEESNIPLIYVQVSESFEGIYKEIENLAKITKTQAKGEELIEHMKNKVNKIIEIRKNIQNRKEIYFEIGSSGALYTFGEGTFLNSMIEIVGAKNVFNSKKGWLQVSEESVVKANPEVILTNESYLKNPIESIEKREGFKDMVVVKNKNIKVVDSNLTSRGSQHTIEGLIKIAKAIYPDEYKDF